MLSWSSVVVVVVLVVVVVVGGGGGVPTLYVSSRSPYGLRGVPTGVVGDLDADRVMAGGGEGGVVRARGRGVLYAPPSMLKENV